MKIALTALALTCAVAFLAAIVGSLVPQSVYVPTFIGFLFSGPVAVAIVDKRRTIHWGFLVATIVVVHVSSAFFVAFTEVATYGGNYMVTFIAVMIVAIVTALLVAPAAIIIKRRCVRSSSQ